MKLSTGSSNKIIINNDISYSQYSIHQIIFPIIILSLGLLILSLLYYTYKYFQKKENSQYTFLFIFKLFKKWKENFGKSSYNSSSSLSFREKEIDNLINKSGGSEELEEDSINRVLDSNNSIIKVIHLKKVLLFKKIIPNPQAFINDYLRNQYFNIKYLLISHSINVKYGSFKKGNIYFLLKRKLMMKNDIDRNYNATFDNLLENNINKNFETTFDNLLENDINEDFIDPDLLKESIISSSLSSPTTTKTTTSSTIISDNTPVIPKNNTTKHKKFHFDYYSKKIIFHPNSLYHEQNAKKYNTIEGNFERDLQFSSVTIVLTTGNQKELPYFPRYPWYWDGVELFAGITIQPKPYYHPNYLSLNWKPSKNIINSKRISSTSNNKKSISLTLNNNDNKRNFTLSLTRTNSF
ncbi:hypothetical protein LY90DRAFT_668206 [Neocallimastix californiae]|uniref:Uncharacterized protein n=1 Tax=Neocallimastix californiae TaxID=1754190 RepID=A0A1Y2DWW4_9FUNG|nr:hypothetical protein LY90DRAFT_668206 [Neocallimastix californiae]|eukprot:ORY63737.1 hypothetical protein LY90DRAFT_668206 [Neocallimastix californiae]